MADKQSLYELLGLTDKASPEDIQNAHAAMRQALELLPDSEDKHNRIAILNTTRDMLLDRRQRAGYDRRKRDRRDNRDDQPQRRLLGARCAGDGARDQATGRATGRARGLGPRGGRRRALHGPGIDTGEPVHRPGSDPGKCAHGTGRRRRRPAGQAGRRDRLAAAAGPVGTGHANPRADNRSRCPAGDGTRRAAATFAGRIVAGGCNQFHRRVDLRRDRRRRAGHGRGHRTRQAADQLPCRRAASRR